MLPRAIFPRAAIVASVWVWLVASFLSGGDAWAQARRTPHRTVAVIDATGGATRDPEAAKLAARIESQLDREADLVPVASEGRPALVGAIPDERRPVTAEARSALARARDALARFDHKDAVAEADRGIRRAVDLVPDGEIVSILTELALTRGLGRLADNDAVGATRDFALVHRLDRERRLDPVKYLPEVIEQFDRAAKVAAMTSIDVAAPAGATVWVDGVSVGEAPATIAVSQGLHAVTVGGDRLIGRGQVVDATGKGAKVELDAAEASATIVIHRLRLRLAAAENETQRADAVAAIVRAVGAQDAIVVDRNADGAVVTRLYSGRTGTLGEPRPSSDPREILKPLRPLKVPEPPPGEPQLPPLPPPWYQRRAVQVGIGGTIVVGVVTAVIVALTRPTGSSSWQGLCAAEQCVGEE